MANYKPRFDWKEIQEYYNNGHSAKECSAAFGITPSSITRAAKRGAIILRSYPEAVSMGHIGRVPVSQETKDKLSKVAKDRGFGGKNYRKVFRYKGILLESSYEYSLALELDSKDIKWTRPLSFKWVDSKEKERRYTPDFYLPDYNVYLDPKNDYLIKIDGDKIQRVCDQNGIKVLILNKSQLTWEYIAGIV